MYPIEVWNTCCFMHVFMKLTTGSTNVAFMLLWVLQQTTNYSAIYSSLCCDIFLELRVCYCQFVLVYTVQPLQFWNIYSLIVIFCMILKFIVMFGPKMVLSSFWYKYIFEFRSLLIRKNNQCWVTAFIINCLSSQNVSHICTKLTSPV
jgi:hypothetical protein